MEQKTLKFFRLLLPGIITVIIGGFYLSIITNKPFQTFEIKEYSINGIVAILIGVVFYLFDVRYLITNYSHKKIDLNIKNHILLLYSKSLNSHQRQYLFQNNRLKNVFYKIIDNDESLKKKQTNIFLNGLIWTTTADLAIISFFSAVVYLLSIGIFKSQTNHLLISGFILILISFIALVAHWLAFHKHINLSNEQIEYIENHHVNKVEELISAMLARA